MLDTWIANGWPGTTGVVAFLFMLGLTPLVIRLAHRKNWVAHPQSNRWHRRPTALMGGIALYLAATAALVAGALVHPGAAAELLRSGMLWAGATVMFVTGVVDDRRNIRPAAKLAAQLLAAGLLLSAGYRLGAGPLWLSAPLTLFWVIGITNALNLLDNMDGLAAGVAAIAAGMFAVVALRAGNPAAAAVALAVAGAAGGFLVFNFKPARIFMGDSGSLFLGYLVAALALQGPGAAPADFVAAFLLPAAILAVPIFDTTLVTIARTCSGRSVSQGGRDHSSHRLVFLGLSERRAVLVLYGVSLLFGGAALLAYGAGTRLALALLVLLAVGLAAFGVFLAGADVYLTAEEAARGERSYYRVLGGDGRAARLLRHHRFFFGLLADVLLVGAAYELAFHLRFEDGLGAVERARLDAMLPFVLGAKPLVFAAFGLYRGVWRLAGASELARVAAASVVASAACGAAFALVYGWGGFSLSVLVIDALLTTFVVTGVRVVFRGLPHYLAASRREGRRVLLYGAGETGRLALREIHLHPQLGLCPVGLLDDDPLKQGASIQGVRVLGRLSDLPSLCRMHGVDEVLITAARMSPARRAEILARCTPLGVACREARLSFAEVAAGDGTPVGDFAVTPQFVMEAQLLDPGLDASQS